MAARPASLAWPAPLTRIRYSTTPSPRAARRTGRITTAADRRRLSAAHSAAPGSRRGVVDAHHARADAPPEPEHLARVVGIDARRQAVARRVRELDRVIEAGVGR